MSIDVSPEIRCFPPDDRRFAGDVEGALRSLGEAPDAEGLESRLRSWYPGCVVRRQADLAWLDGDERWYAYRDGSAHPLVHRSERLYAALGRARDLVASTLNAVDRAAASPAADRDRTAAQARELHERFDDHATRRGRS